MRTMSRNDPTARTRHERRTMSAQARSIFYRMYGRMAVTCGLALGIWTIAFHPRPEELPRNFWGMFVRTATEEIWPYMIPLALLGLGLGLAMILYSSHLESITEDYPHTERNR